MNYDEILKSYEDNGFYLWESFCDEDYCSELKSYLSSLPSKINIAYSKIAWGYGNLLNKGPFKSLTEDARLIEVCNRLWSLPYIFNHLYVHNKVKWLGNSIEWHQEVFNVDTYAPGYSADSDWDKFAQFYIALDDQNLENGCIKVLPGSHKLGILPSEDMMNENFGHKRRVTFDAMTDAYEKCGIKNCEMKQGDLLIFNHRLIHGSSPNCSPFDRKAIVLQAREDSIEKDTDIFSKEKEYRKNFVLSAVEKKYTQLKSENLYGDFEVKEEVKNEDK